MTYTAREVTSAPFEAVSKNTCNMGTYNTPIQHVNLTELKTPLGFKAPSLWNKFRLKEWQAFQISNEDWFICLAVYNTKSLGTAIIMAFNKSERKMYQYEQKVPAWQLTVPKSLFATHCYYHGKKLSIDFNNHLADGYIDISFNARGFKNLPDINAKLKAFHSGEPIVIVQPFDENRPLYSHKALMELEGSIQFDGQESACLKGKSCAIVDDHKGYYPYVMQYDWVTGLGIDNQGRMLGFNLTDNQIQDHERFNENCLWLDGKMLALPPITVTRPHGVDKTWYIKDQYGRVDLAFTPLADVPVNINAGIAKVNYNGPTGQFSGFILDSEDNKVSFDDFIGMGEKKYVRM